MATNGGLEVLLTGRRKGRRAVWYEIPNGVIDNAVTHVDRLVGWFLIRRSAVVTYCFRDSAVRVNRSGLSFLVQ